MKEQQRGPVSHNIICEERSFALSKKNCLNYMYNARQLLFFLNINNNNFKCHTHTKTEGKKTDTFKTLHAFNVSYRVDSLRDSKFIITR